MVPDPLSDGVTPIKQGPPNESCVDCFYFYRPVEEVADLQPGSGICLRYPPDKDMRYAWTRDNYWCGEYKSATVVT